jgi:hypothetical protein
MFDLIDLCDQLRSIVSQLPLALQFQDCLNQMKKGG